MNVYDFLKHTILIVIPASILVCLVLYCIGYPQIALGLFIGVAGGAGKAIYMTYSAISDVSPIISMFFRYFILGIVMVLAIQISIHSFFAAIVGIFFVQIVFVMEQVRASSLGGIG